jgi:hypothetical protein
MNIYINARMMLSKTTNDWVVAFTPLLHLSRHDVFSDEAAYYFGFIWLVFQANVVITSKKKEIPTGED